MIQAGINIPIAYSSVGQGHAVGVGDLRQVDRVCVNALVVAEDHVAVIGQWPAAAPTDHAAHVCVRAVDQAGVVVRVAAAFVEIVVAFQVETVGQQYSRRAAGRRVQDRRG